MEWKAVKRLTPLALGSAIGVAVWWRKNPSACPYGHRFWIEAPHPFITRDRLLATLQPQPGERILEIGPGTGYYTLDVARALQPNGTLDIFDLQQEMLDHTMRGAGEAGIANLVPQQGNAEKLPYDDGSFDAVYLVTVLGEVPNRAAALREIHRRSQARWATGRGRTVRRSSYGDFEPVADGDTRCPVHL